MCPFVFRTSKDPTVNVNSLSSDIKRCVSSHFIRIYLLRIDMLKVILHTRVNDYSDLMITKDILRYFKLFSPASIKCRAGAIFTHPSLYNIKDSNLILVSIRIQYVLSCAIFQSEYSQLYLVELIHELSPSTEE